MIRPSPVVFSSDDLEQLRARGIEPEDAARQIEVLRAPPAYMRLDRPCTVGDGITTLDKDEAADLKHLYDDAVQRGRCGMFVPASGAASRMFKDVLDYRARGGAPTAEVRALMKALPRLAFYRELAGVLAARGEPLDSLLAGESYGPIVDAMLDADGLGYGERPKALLPFHAYPSGPRTALEEHLHEAATLMKDAEETCRLHFTVSPEHVESFEKAIEALKASLARDLRVRYDIGLSAQSPATDTLAIEGTGERFRDESARLLLRPSGHGALLPNLAACGGDIVFLKNIDNVTVDGRKGTGNEWCARLICVLVRTQDRVHPLLERIEEGDRSAAEEAARFAETTFHRQAPPGADARALLHRPIRVCGMVPNTGEPGGGPFWAPDGEGVVTPQVVETSQVDPGSAGQQAIVRKSTHFNPVFMACGLRDHRGKPYDLARYVDPRAFIVTRKSAGAREVVALERPGLWNGAMAGWNTIFVEVPLGVFNPVKTIADLLRPEHQVQ